MLVDKDDAYTAADVLDALAAILSDRPEHPSYGGRDESKKLADVADSIRRASRHTGANSQIGAAEWERCLRAVLDVPSE